MSDFVDLFAEGLIRMAVVVSFPLIIRTKSLSWGTRTEQLFSSVVRNIAFLTKKRERVRERKRERGYSVFLNIQWKPGCARHSGAFQ